ncbi:hypothetical protein MtrunA17_Chr2g0289591 [Medicago truncatula]|uniref:Uncharacterized protein n=1 Tax=Medicago truncatula TaxID=3880 RepID=A0A396J8D0_MEDTR|nr:hypothetical protein MtrunA17_Chr2g0289591 [Medicago truncatula]
MILTNSRISYADINTFDKEICSIFIYEKDHLHQHPTNPYEKTKHQSQSSSSYVSNTTLTLPSLLTTLVAGPLTVGEYIFR